MKRLSYIAIICALVFGCSAPRRAAQRPAPVIGISAGGVSQSRVGQAYIDAVCDAGGVPVIIPILTDSLALAAILERVDGVLMIGGEDIDPVFYGERALPEMEEINAPRDTFDLMLARMTSRCHKPLLGICRGEQAINVAFGGTLWQDIPTQVASSGIIHRSDDGAVHDIHIAAGSRLAALTGFETASVNSFHHQAAKDPARGFMVTATTEDGVIEALERFDGGDRIIAVQFHPEKMLADGDRRFQVMFEWLIQESLK